MQSSRRENVRYMDVGQALRACVASCKGTKPLGERSLDPGAFVRPRLEGFGGLTLSCRLHSLLRLLRAYREDPTRRVRRALRAWGTAGTRTTILDGTGAVANRVASSIVGWRPTLPGLACRTRRTRPVPIARAWRGRNTGVVLCLPVIIPSCGSTEIDLVVLPTVHEGFRIHRAGLHELLLRQELVRGERFLKREKSSILCVGIWGGFDGCHQVRSVLITGLGEMHVVARPKGLSLVSTKSFGVRRGGEHGSCCRRMGERTPAPFSFLPRQMRSPHASERLDGRDLTEPEGCGISRKSVKAWGSIFSNEKSIGFTSLVAIGETISFHPVFLPLDPRFSPLLGEPRWSTHRQTLQDRPKGLSDSFSPGE